MKAHESWDIIGDIHGHADQLQALLEAMGYERKVNGYFHPRGLKALFLGDYIDRGPKIRETLQIVRQMVDSGNALAIMGNHEFNALAYSTPDGNGGWLREHTPEKVAQHVQTQLQIAAPHPEEWQDWLNWFASLPLFLDLGNLRAVHAAWNDESIAALHGISTLDAGLLGEMTTKNRPLYTVREILLNGIEIDLPDGFFFSDKSGFRRSKIRTKWWEKLGVHGVQTYKQAVFPNSNTVPNIPIPDGQCSAHSYGLHLPPVFFGHYWLPADGFRAPLEPNVACLDFSVAKGGRLTAYRWDGEQILDPKKFVTAGEPDRHQ